MIAAAHPPVRVLEADPVLCPQCGTPWKEHPRECYNEDCEFRGKLHCHAFRLVKVGR